MEFNTWLTFLAAAVAISLSPGPGAIAAMGAGLNHGFRHGQVIAFGLLMGVWTQTLVVGFGLGMLLSTSEIAFSVVKWVGAAYLVWLGIQQWRAPVRPLVAPEATRKARCSSSPCCRSSSTPRGRCWRSTWRSAPPSAWSSVW